MPGGNEVEDVDGDGCVVVDGGVEDGEAIGVCVGGGGPDGNDSVGDGEVVVGCGSPPGVGKSDEQNNLCVFNANPR